jgi:hypothetical protein
MAKEKMRFASSRSSTFLLRESENQRLTQMEMPDNVALLTPKEFVESALKIRGFSMAY